MLVGSLPDDFDDDNENQPDAAVPANNAPDPFDPESLRLGQDFGDSLGGRRILTTLPIRKPNRQEWVRVRPGSEWRLETAAFEDKQFRETYLVDRSLWQALAGDICPVCLFLVANRQGDAFLWPCKLPGADGRSNTWNGSALTAALLAESKWVRVAANMSAGAYDVYQASADLPEPTWPELSFPELLKLAFKGRFINSLDHPVLQALRGEK